MAGGGVNPMSSGMAQQGGQMGPQTSTGGGFMGQPTFGSMPIPPGDTFIPQANRPPVNVGELMGIFGGLNQQAPIAPQQYSQMQQPVYMQPPMQTAAMPMQAQPSAPDFAQLSNALRGQSVVQAPQQVAQPFFEQPQAATPMAQQGIASLPRKSPRLFQSMMSKRVR